uniref:Uncharacterized protein n=1 Tax=Gasterosteus aculeatus TaxID=69293 RepID=G3PCS0_GASAC
MCFFLMHERHLVVLIAKNQAGSAENTFSSVSSGALRRRPARSGQTQVRLRCGFSGKALKLHLSPFGAGASPRRSVRETTRTPGCWREASPVTRVQSDPGRSETLRLLPQSPVLV